MPAVIPVTSPSEDGDGGFRAMQMALDNATLNPEEINYINDNSK